MRDTRLCAYAHNVKSIARDGQVTLTSPGRTDAEEQSVAAKAVEGAGAEHVVNQLSVAPGRSTHTS